MNDKKSNSLVSSIQHGLTVHSTALASRGLAALQARQSEQVAKQSRWLRFSEEASVGKVYIGEESAFGDNSFLNTLNNRLQEYDACGVIEVPFGKVAGLEIREGVNNLSFVKNLDSHTLYALKCVSRPGDQIKLIWSLLEHFPHLSHLELYGGVDDAGLVHLKSLAKLTFLKLVDCNQITGAGLVHLKSLTKLIIFRLFGCNQITDAGLAHFKSITSLTSLRIFRCGEITDEGLAHLTSLTSLSDLRFRSNLITDVAIAKFQQALPNCKVDVHR